MPDGTYYLYAAGKDLVGNWARTPEVMIVIDNNGPVIAGHADMTLVEGEAFPTDTVTLTDNIGLGKVFVRATDLTNGLGFCTG